MKFSMYLVLNFVPMWMPAEIGPAAKAAVPRLKKMMDEEINDEIAAAAKRALRRIQPEAVSGE